MMVKPWHEIAKPHKDVLEGTFKQSGFAADISLDPTAIRQVLKRPLKAINAHPVWHGRLRDDPGERASRPLLRPGWPRSQSLSTVVSSIPLRCTEAKTGLCDDRSQKYDDGSFFRNQFQNTLSAKMTWIVTG